MKMGERVLRATIGAGEGIIGLGGSLILAACAGIGVVNALYEGLFLAGLTAQGGNLVYFLSNFHYESSFGSVQNAFSPSLQLGFYAISAILELNLARLTGKLVMRGKDNIAQGFSGKRIRRNIF